MGRKIRTQVPDAVADHVLFEADRTCCICRQHGKPIQIHHLDSNPSNHNLKNLIVLCLDHHHEASLKSTIGRGFSPGLLRRYRDDWHAFVRNKRETALQAGFEAKDPVDAHLEALACHDVRKLSFGLNAEDWDLVNQRLSDIYPFASSWYYGNHLRREVLDVAYIVVSMARREMPAETAELVREVAFAALPIASLVFKAREAPTESQRELLRSAVEIGSSLAYEGIKYLKDIGVLDAGARLLWTILRYAHLNGIEDLKRRVLEEFDGLQKLASEFQDKDAKRWLEFQRDDALALDDDALPVFPKEVADRVHQSHYRSK